MIARNQAHGSCYSPADAKWPGWVFYAATQMNPRNSIWRDVPALNTYITRCQAMLQGGKPDNDVLLYWPSEDSWYSTPELAPQMIVHHVEWLREQAIGTTADMLWQRGYAFDFISDAQVSSHRAACVSRRIIADSLGVGEAGETRPAPTDPRRLAR